MAETIKEYIPIENNLPLPLPSHALGLETGTFAKDVEEGKFAETGPVQPGTKIVPTKYSLDHYMAQQWNLDVDKMPVSVPDFLVSFYPLATFSFYHHFAFIFVSNLNLEFQICLEQCPWNVFAPLQKVKPGKRCKTERLDDFEK